MVVTGNFLQQKESSDHTLIITFLTNTNILNNKKNIAFQEENPLNLLQFHHSK